MVRVEFLARRTVHNQAKVKAKAKVKSECPYLYFKSHDESRTTQVCAEVFKLELVLLQIY